MTVVSGWKFEFAVSGKKFDDFVRSGRQFDDWV